MVTLKYLLICVLTLLLIKPITSSNILGYFITPSRSHFIIHESLMKGLAGKGHNVTVVSFFPAPNKMLSNYKHIQLEMNPTNSAAWNRLTSGLQDENRKNSFSHVPEMVRALTNINTDTYTHPLVEKLRQENTFDLVIFGWFFNDYQVGIATQFKCPAVMLATMNAMKPLRDFVANPQGAAFSPMALTSFPVHMSFWQRVVNFGVSLNELAAVQLMNYFVFEPEYTHNFPLDKHPSFAEAKQNVALVLVTSHFAQGHPMLSFPGMIEVSGMHIKRTPDPLPQNIQNFLDNATNGVVYFSLGTNIKIKEIPMEKLRVILAVLARLKQNVLWKVDNDTLEGVPGNVMIQKWLPQDDVLAHPNVRLFISHCGKGGVNEARYHGVPILGMPFFADQPANLAQVEAEGWGVPLKYSELDENTFETALENILNNPSYTNVAKRESLLFRDRPQHPLDTAIFWVEYVIRHKGAKHMQSPAVHMTWYQYYSVDVIALYVFVIWALLKLIKLIVLSVWKGLVKRNSKPKTE